MSTIFTVEIYGKSTKLMSSDINYDYYYDVSSYYPYKYKLSMSSSGGEFDDPDHIPPAIDQNSISSISSSLSMVYGGSTSTNDGTPSVVITGKELLDFLSNNAISLLQSKIIIKVSIDGVSTTIFIGRISSTKYLSSISVQVTSIANSFELSPTKSLVLSQENAPGIDPNLYGTEIDITIGDSSKVRAYPVVNSDYIAPSIRYEGLSRPSLESYIDGIGGNEAYIVDGNGTPKMCSTFVVSDIYNFPDETTTYRVDGRAYTVTNNTVIRIFEDSGLATYLEHYNDYYIEVIAGKGKGNLYEITSVGDVQFTGIPITLTKRIADDEIQSFSKSYYNSGSTYKGLQHSVDFITGSWSSGGSYGRLEQIDVDVNSTHPVYVPPDDYKGIHDNSSGASLLRFKSKRLFFVIPKKKIDQGLYGYNDFGGIESLWHKDVGDLPLLATDIEVVDEADDYLVMMYKGTFNPSQSTITAGSTCESTMRLCKLRTLPDYLASSYAIIYIDRTEKHYAPAAILVQDKYQFGTSRSYVVYTLGIPSQTSKEYEVISQILTYNRIDLSTSNIGGESGSSVYLDHNIEILQMGPVQSSVFVDISVKYFIVNEDNYSNGFETIDSGELSLSPGEMDSINGVYSSDSWRAFSEKLKSVDLSSRIIEDGGTMNRYIMTQWAFRFRIPNTATAGAHFGVTMAKSEVRTKRNISINDLYCTLRKPVGAPDISNPCDLAKLMLTSSGIDLDASSFSSVSSSMPNASNPSITMKASEMSQYLSSLCKWSMMSIIKTRDGIAKAKWWIDDYTQKNPIKVFTNEEIKDGILSINKDSSGSTASSFSFKFSDSISSDSNLVISTTIEELAFPASSAWSSLGNRAFPVTSGDSWESISDLYKLYKSSVVPPFYKNASLDSLGPFRKGFVYEFFVPNVSTFYMRLIDFCYTNDGKTSILFKREARLFSTSIVPILPGLQTNFVKFANQQQDWKYLVSGSDVASSDYSMAKHIWEMAQENRIRIGQFVELPSDVSEIDKNALGSAYMQYVSYLVSHNTTPKVFIEFSVDLETDYLQYEESDFVTIKAGQYSASGINGHIQTISVNPDTATVSFSVMCVETDQDLYIINENHSLGLSAPLLLIESEDGFNINEGA